jgi:hypothetical protein
MYRPEDAMTDENDEIENWPAGLRLLTLTREAWEAWAWSEKLRRRDEHFGSSMQQNLTDRLADVRRLLAGLSREPAPLVAAAAAFSESVAGHGDVPPDGPWPEEAALREAVEASLRAEMPTPALDEKEWTWRMQALARRPWVGPEAWGAPAGWLPLLERGVAQTERWSEAAERNRDWRTMQVKEKFGTLRWYVRGSRRFLMIAYFAGLASERTCQACGHEGRLRTEGMWWMTLCEEHAAMDEAGLHEALGRLCYPPRPGRGGS